MGQRLVVQIFNKQDDVEPLATIYYHWSAYTRSAIAEIDTLVSNFSDEFNQLSDVDKLIQIYMGTSGVVMEDAGMFEELTGIMQDPNRLERNSGLMAISQKEQGELLFWSEGTVPVYLDTQTFDLSDLFFLIDHEDFEYLYDATDETYEKVVNEAVEFDPHHLALAKTDGYMEFINNHSWFNIDGELFAPIE